MDDKRQYNVWARTDGNEWNPVLTVHVSQATAETLAALLAHENRVPHDDLRFVCSIHRPTSFGFKADTLTIKSTARRNPEPTYGLPAPKR